MFLALVDRDFHACSLVYNSIFVGTSSSTPSATTGGVATGRGVGLFVGRLLLLVGQHEQLGTLEGGTLWVRVPPAVTNTARGFV